jgi:integrase/recombinase XerD
VAWLPVEPVDRFLGYLQVLPRSPNTVAAYAYDLRGLVEFLDRQRVEWTEVEVDHLACFVGWLEQPAGNVALLLGAEPARSGPVLSSPAV